MYPRNLQPPSLGTLLAHHQGDGDFLLFPQAPELLKVRDYVSLIWYKPYQERRKPDMSKKKMIIFNHT